MHACMRPMHGRWEGDLMHAPCVHACMHTRPGELACNATHRGRQPGATQGSGAGGRNACRSNASPCVQMHPMHSMHALHRASYAPHARPSTHRGRQPGQGHVHKVGRVGARVPGRKLVCTKGTRASECGRSRMLVGCWVGSGPLEPAGPRVGRPSREAVCGMHVRDARARTHGGEWARWCFAKGT
jgi:hypothetical protein